MASKSRCKVELPNQLPASGLTRVQFKTWKEALTVYLKQNEDFLVFLPGGIYSTWSKTEDNNERIDKLDITDKEEDDNEYKKKKRLNKRRTDLHTMLNIIGGKTDQYDYDDVLNMSTSLESVWMMLEQSYDIGRKGIQFLELQNITYDKKESPVKFYERIYHLVMDNLYKKDEVFKTVKQEENEKLSPTFLNFIMFYVLEKIDTRLIKEVKDKWGHVLDSDKSLHELKDIILKGVPDILLKLDQQEDENNILSAFTNNRNKSYPKKQFPRGNFQGGKRPQGKSFCRLCQTAGEPRRIYTSHSVYSCRRWTKKDVEDLRYMMCEMQVNPEDYDSTDSDE